jgi:ABC-type nickel/cobalt efflux system permease component RcnA
MLANSASAPTQFSFVVIARHPVQIWSRTWALTLTRTKAQTLTRHEQEHKHEHKYENKNECAYEHAHVRVRMRMTMNMNMKFFFHQIVLILGYFDIGKDLNILCLFGYQNKNPVVRQNFFSPKSD